LGLVRGAGVSSEFMTDLSANTKQLSDPLVSAHIVNKIITSTTPTALNKRFTISTHHLPTSQRVNKEGYKT